MIYLLELSLRLVFPCFSVPWEADLRCTCTHAQCRLFGPVSVPQAAIFPCPEAIWSLNNKTSSCHERVKCSLFPSVCTRRIWDSSPVSQAYLHNRATVRGQCRAVHCHCIATKNQSYLHGLEAYIDLLPKPLQPRGPFPSPS